MEIEKVICPQCSGKVDVHLSGHTSVGRKFQTSTIFVLSAIYLPLLRR